MLRLVALIAVCAFSYFAVLISDSARFLVQPGECEVAVVAECVTVALCSTAVWSTAKWALSGLIRWVRAQH